MQLQLPAIMDPAQLVNQYAHDGTRHPSRDKSLLALLALLVSCHCSTLSGQPPMMATPGPGFPPLVAANATARRIYHSSQTPGYTAWVGLWTMPGTGEITTNFIEAKGLYPNNASFSFPVLVTYLSTAFFHCRPSYPMIGRAGGQAMVLSYNACSVS
eukprot:SAG11_NODE_1567_length_4672_cov_13.208834_1_plen_157_part_00